MTTRVAECTLAKGAYTVTIYAMEVIDHMTNKISTITPGSSRQKQSDGPKATKVIDLLRITRTFKIRGYLTGATAKSDILSITKGAGLSGGVAVFSYPDGGDATSFNVFVQDVTISQKPSDEPSGTWIDGVWQAGVLPSDVMRYDLDLTLVEGTTIGGS